MIKEPKKKKYVRNETEYNLGGLTIFNVINLSKRLSFGLPKSRSSKI